MCSKFKSRTLVILVSYVLRLLIIHFLNCFKKFASISLSVSTKNIRIIQTLRTKFIFTMVHDNNESCRTMLAKTNCRCTHAAVNNANRCTILPPCSNKKTLVKSISQRLSSLRIKFILSMELKIIQVLSLHAKSEEKWFLKKRWLLQFVRRGSWVTFRNQHNLEQKIDVIDQVADDSIYQKNSEPDARMYSLGHSCVTPFQRLVFNESSTVFPAKLSASVNYWCCLFSSKMSMYLCTFFMRINNSQIT